MFASIEAPAFTRRKAAAILTSVCIIPKVKYPSHEDLNTVGHFETDVKKREIVAWAMYDFANSGYTTVVITAVFNAYFVAVVAANAA